MTPAQARAARALIGVNQGSLAASAGVSLSTIVDFERERRQVSAFSVSAIRDALEGAGVDFISENGSDFGVILRTKHPE